MDTSTLTDQYADAGLTDAPETRINLDPAPTPAEEMTRELEYAYRWEDWQVACGDPDPDGGWWPELSATHGS